MTTRCVEPAVAAEGPYEYLVEVEADDELLFPHVDSCLAIAFILEDGRVLGGHVGMMLPGADSLDPYGNAMSICEQMLGKRKGAQVRRVILVGDGNWERDFIEQRDVVGAIIGATSCLNSLFIDTGAFGGGVDVSLNPRRSMVFVQQCVGAKAFAFQRPYARIEGHKRERLG